MTDQLMIVPKKILVAPLNWGLGHATRCICVIKALEKHGFVPIIASDGQALALLEKEFPHLMLLELPSYEIQYADDGENFKWKMLKNLPALLEAVAQEKKIVKRWIVEHGINGIISDNRLGVLSKNIPSVFITHQLNVLSGNTTWISGKLHRNIIEKFSECWVPDADAPVNLSGKLGHLKQTDLRLKYIGPLSRFRQKSQPLKYDLMVLLSGPEPQRTNLERILKKELKKYKEKIIFISGIVENTQSISESNSITTYNYMTSNQLENAFSESALILCRSGYTTIMDLSKLAKKVFFIPTPGQYEQEYLAKKLKKQGFAPYAKQNQFRIEDLLQVDLYKGIPNITKEIDWEELFGLFKREGEL